MNNLLHAIMDKISGSVLSTDVGGRIYLDRAPDETVFPYIVFFIVSETPDRTFTERYTNTLIQFSLFSASSGASEITTIYHNLKDLFDECALTFSNDPVTTKPTDTLVWMKESNLTTMVDDFTVVDATQSIKHWAVDFEILTSLGELPREEIPTLLLKTGQTTQYGGYPDDGYYQKGLSKSYTILTEDQFAGTTSITLNLKTDVHSNNCIYDNRTRLMWSRYPSATLGPNSNGTLPWTTNGNLEGIFPYCAAANAANLGGYSDWRIPNALEILSLASNEAPNAIPDITAFPVWGTPPLFWTSTTGVSLTTNAVNMNFSTGTKGTNPKIANLLVALVRG